MKSDLRLIGAANADSPSLIFQRGKLLADDYDNTSYYDWRIYNTSGNLKFQVNASDSSTWSNDILTLSSTGATISGKIVKSGGTASQVLMANGDVKALSDFKIGDYVKLSDTEQTIESTISSFTKGIVEFYRSSGDHIAFISFSNKDGNGNKRMLGSIGFHSGGVGKLEYRDVNAQYYPILHTGNTTQSAITLTWGTNSNAIKLGGTNINISIPTKPTLDDIADGSTRKLADYIPLAGTSTSNPITGTLYSTKGIYIYPGNTTDVDVWHVDGNSSSWDNHYGFTLKYLGSNSGNDNDLVLEAHNQSGTHVETYRIHQNGQLIFGVNPYVGANVILHSGNISSYAITSHQSLSNYVTLNGA